MSAMSAMSPLRRRLAPPLVCLLIGSLIIVGTPGCVVHHEELVYGHALYATMAERRARGEAQVPASDVTEDGEKATTVTIKRDAMLGIDGGKIRLEELERGCEAKPVQITSARVEPDVGVAGGASPPPDASCPLRQYDDARLVVRRYDETRAPALGTVIGVVGLSAIGAAVACEVGCPEDTTAKTASDITLISLGALFGVALVWSFIDCMGKWGQRGCRD